jgi:hypothetical protein
LGTYAGAKEHPQGTVQQAIGQGLGAPEGVSAQATCASMLLIHPPGGTTSLRRDKPTARNGTEHLEIAHFSLRQTFHTGRTGQEVFTLAAHAQYADAVRFTSDGQGLLTHGLEAPTTRSYAVKRWDGSIRR